MARSRRKAILSAALVALAAGSTMARADDCSSLRERLAEKQDSIALISEILARDARQLELLHNALQIEVDKPDGYANAKKLHSQYDDIREKDLSYRVLLGRYKRDVNLIQDTLALAPCDPQPSPANSPQPSPANSPQPSPANSPQPSPANSPPNNGHVDNTAIAVAGLGEVAAGGVGGLDLGSSGGTPTPPPPPMPSVIGLPDGQTSNGVPPRSDLVPSTGLLNQAAGGLNAGTAALDNATSDTPQTQPGPSDTSPQPLLPARTASLPQSGSDLPAPDLLRQAAGALNARNAALDDATSLSSGGSSTAAPVLPPRAPTATAAPSSDAGSGPMGYCRYAGTSFTLNVQWPAASPCPSAWCQGWGGTSTSNESPGIIAGHCTDPSQTMVPLTCSGQVWGGPCGSSSVTASSTPNVILPSRSFPAATPAPVVRANLCSTVSPHSSPAPVSVSPPSFSAPVSVRQAAHGLSAARSISAGATRQATRNLCAPSHGATRSANSFRTASAATHSGASGGGMRGFGGFGGGMRGFGGFGGGMRGHR